MNELQKQLLQSIKTLKPFVGEGQLIVMVELSREKEEGDWYKNKIVEMAQIIEKMPHSYQTDGQGKKAIAHLHYFIGGANYYITEKDKGDPRDEVQGEQIQAFGLADPFGDGGELGYISIKEITEAGGELDLHWTPRALEKIRD